MPDPITLNVESDKAVTLLPEETLIDPLEELFTEVNALAIRLRQEARRGQIADELPTGGDNVLRTLSRFGAQTVPQIARLNRTSRQNIQTIVNRLSREGCVEFAPNPAHKRSELVELTERGRASFAAVGRIEKGYKDKLLGAVIREDLVRSSKLLRNIREVMTMAAEVESKVESKDAELPQPKREALRRSQSMKVDAHRLRSERIEVEKRPFETEELPVSLL